MKDFATVPNITGAFPNVFSTNVSVPGAADGTPAIKQWVDDIWGCIQAILDHANLSPDTVTEAAGTSQVVESLQLTCSYPGEIVTHIGQEADPSVLGIRALPCNGQGILPGAKAF